MGLFTNETDRELIHTFVFGEYDEGWEELIIEELKARGVYGMAVHSCDEMSKALNIFLDKGGIK